MSTIYKILSKDYHENEVPKLESEFNLSGVKLHQLINKKILTIDYLASDNSKSLVVYEIEPHYIFRIWECIFTTTKFNKLKYLIETNHCMKINYDDKKIFIQKDPTPELTAHDLRNLSIQEYLSEL